MNQSASKHITKRSEIIGKKLADLRLNRGYTQTELCNEIGIAQTTYAGYETGRHEPSADTLIKLANVYEISLDYLVGRYVDAEPNEMPYHAIEETIHMDSKERQDHDEEMEVRLHLEREQKKEFAAMVKTEVNEKSKRGKYNRAKKK